MIQQSLANLRCGRPLNWSGVKRRTESWGCNTFANILRGCDESIWTKGCLRVLIKENLNQFRFASINEHNILNLLCHNAAGTWNLLFVPALCKTCGSFWVPPVPNYTVRIQVPLQCSGANMFTKIESHFFKMCFSIFFGGLKSNCVTMPCEVFKRPVSLAHCAYFFVQTCPKRLWHLEFNCGMGVGVRPFLTVQLECENNFQGWLQGSHSALEKTTMQIGIASICFRFVRKTYLC